MDTPILSASTNSNAIGTMQNAPTSETSRIGDAKSLRVLFRCHSLLAWCLYYSLPAFYMRFPGEIDCPSGKTRFTHYNPRLQPQCRGGYNIVVISTSPLKVTLPSAKILGRRVNSGSPKLECYKLCVALCRPCRTTATSRSLRAYSHLRALCTS